MFYYTTYTYPEDYDYNLNDEDMGWFDIINKDERLCLPPVGKPCKPREELRELAIANIDANPF